MQVRPEMIVCYLAAHSTETHRYPACPPTVSKVPTWEALRPKRTIELTEPAIIVLKQELGMVYAAGIPKLLFRPGITSCVQLDHMIGALVLFCCGC